ncbi:DNA/RNA non-specific endonuclease [Streptomyces sp. H34-S4]|uniref:DNA/RNA non-specific endonuclease n=1 Tax=Streptomyces sp. H34-S4 TaxID=2996463 RepID=UPI003B635A74
MLLEDDQFNPDQAISTQGALGATPALPGGSGQDDDPCSRPRSERYYYQPLIDGAPTGARALMCPSDLKPKNSRGDRKGTWEPPGWVSAEDKSGNPAFNRSHIIGDRFYGDWIKENIFTGFREMNSPDMRKCENRMARELKARRSVLYSGQLEYGNGRQNIPTAITMSAYTINGPTFSGVRIANTPGRQVTC